MGSKSALAEVIELPINNTRQRENALQRDALQPESPPRRPKKLSAKKIEQLVLDHRDHGKRLAWSFLSSWRISLHQDEVTSVVGAALCEAASRFDPTRGVEFKTFFFYHLRGMLLKEISRVIQEQRVLQFVPHYVVSGGTDNSDNSNHGSWGGFPIIDRNNPENILEKREVANRCWEACAELDPLEQEVLIRFFVNDEPLIEIADELNYCRCHISRVKSRALDKLGRLLSEYTTAPDGTIDELRLAREEEQEGLRQVRNYTGGRGRRKAHVVKQRSEALKKVMAQMR